MLKYALAAIGAATLFALAFVLLPTGAQRPGPRTLTAGDVAPPDNFVIHDAAPPAPAGAPASPPATPLTPTPSPAGTTDLDAVMQRLRDSAAKQDATVTAPAAPAAPTLATPPPAAGNDSAPASPSSRGWTSVTGQGTRWRMVRSGLGFTVSIDLGNGQVADVHVLPAFANLDPASMNVRVDYLRQTILQNFSTQSRSYSFARDGSVSVDQ